MYKLAQIVVIAKKLIVLELLKYETANDWQLLKN